MYAIQDDAKKRRVLHLLAQAEERKHATKRAKRSASAAAGAHKPSKKSRGKGKGKGGASNVPSAQL